MPRRALSYAPAALVPVALAWVLAADGPAVRPAVVVATVAVAALLAGRAGLPGRRGPAVWLAALLAWAALDAVLRPVAAFDAARAVASGVVALALLHAGSRPRTAAWARTSVALAGATAGLWMIAQRLAHGVRPAGPFGNPNASGTVALLALAVAPALRPRAAAAALAVVGAGGVLASGSRGALIAAGAVAVVWALGARRQRLLAIGAGALAAAAALGLAARLVIDRDPLRWERVQIWGVVARVTAAELPLGCGPSGYADAALARNFPLAGGFARYARLPDLPESDGLAVPAVLGVPGVVLVAGFLLSVATAARRRGPLAWGVAAAVALTSAVNSQLLAPAVAWLAALALGSVLGRPTPARRLGAPLATAATIAVAAMTAAAVMACPDWGIGPSPERLVTAAAAASRAQPPSDAALARAEALAWRACAARPRFAQAWKTVGEIRLERAALRGESGLAAAAAAAYARARRANPLDVWAALGEGRARLMLGDAAGAVEAFNAAVRLEPNCAPAWLELARLRLARGEIDAVRAALGRVEAITRRARGRIFVTDYERTLAEPDPATLARVRAAVGEEP